MRNAILLTTAPQLHRCLSLRLIPLAYTSKTSSAIIPTQPMFTVSLAQLETLLDSRHKQKCPFIYPPTTDDFSEGALHFPPPASFFFARVN